MDGLTVAEGFAPHEAGVVQARPGRDRDFEGSVALIEGLMKQP